MGNCFANNKYEAGSASPPDDTEKFDCDNEREERFRKAVGCEVDDPHVTVL